MQRTWRKKFGLLFRSQRYLPDALGFAATLRDPNFRSYAVPWFRPNDGDGVAAWGWGDLQSNKKNESGKIM